MKYFVYELFTGVGFLNQLFSLETGIYLANVFERKLILIIKYPLCHIGSSSWDYGKILDFFDKDTLNKLLPYGYEVYYANQAVQFLNKNKGKMRLIDFPNQFSNLVLVDKDLNIPSNQKKITNFCANRIPIIFDKNEYNDDENIYISKSNASRCFYNFFTTEQNYKLMNDICYNLILNKEIRDKFNDLYIPQNYTSIHFRFGDKRHKKELIDRKCDVLENHLFEFLKNNHNKDDFLMVTADRKDSKIIEKLEALDYDIIYSDDLIKNCKSNNLKNNSVFHFLIEKMIAENADLFIGHSGSTVSNHIQYNRYINGKDHSNYTNRILKKESSNNDIIFNWNINNSFSAGVSWQTFFPDNIELKDDKAKTNLITLTNTGYLHFTVNLLESMRKLNIDHLLKIYCIGSECFEFFTEFYPNNSIIQIDSSVNNEKWVEYKSCQNPDVVGKKKWADLTSHKFACIQREFDAGNNVIFTDGDIVFEKNPIPYMNKFADTDMEFVCQNDCCDGSREMFCTGFFFFKCTENTKKIVDFKTIQSEIDSFQNDQQYLRRKAKLMKYSYLDLNLFPNGKFFRDKKPQNPFIIHFNYDVGSAKIRRMKIFKKWLIDKDNSKDILDLTNKPKSSKIDLFLKENDVDLKQGSISKCSELFIFFTEFLEKFQINNVVEIGFLAGHISEYFLKKGCKVTSFDLGKFKSIPAGKRYLDMNYQKHELIKGDSKETLPKFIETNKESIDLLIIDGAMDESTIAHDFANAMKLANEDTVIFVNNVVKTPEYIKYWNTNFNTVYRNYIEQGDIIELKEFQEESVGVGGVFCKFTKEL
ncbi:putative fucosylgalactoside 3-alpha-galactosyltransferase [Aureococcus anophagefferens virus]|uniref:Putative fucosylgalactoside 3-alpha-galactosyltransferase n=1 Tax=Aureococcus anophagefferens virus TaxID=1474867 RepID=A0A076FFT3_9VIRU|nr:putative fucosylgalactoside 3-alpha-galactosyltransferase [Aureococcus anophagefferens virus]AII17144.1 putative fucosylgalactoside 3-alpha-galactosyltransferase [Aureococcus anophagefferens virus]UOG94294.1 hypothetical protein MKD35_259 [Aureococcus anophagefferens virus]